MAIRYWTDSGVAGKFDDVNNWSATDGGAGGASVPVTGDTFILKRGTHSITSGLNQSAQTYAAAYILPGFGGDAPGVSVGDSSGNALQFSATSVVIDNSRCRFIRLSGSMTTIETKALGGDFFLSGGDATSVRLGEMGYAEFADDVELTNFDSAGCGFLIKGDSTSALDLVMDVSSGCNGECWRKIHTLNLDGTLTTAEDAVGSATSGTSIWRVGCTGKLIIGQRGDIANLYLKRGATVTAVGGSGATSAAAVAPTIAVLRVHRGAKVTLPPNLINVTTKQYAGWDSGSSVV